MGNGRFKKPGAKRTPYSVKAAKRRMYNKYMAQGARPVHEQPDYTPKVRSPKSMRRHQRRAQ